ncbi:MAG: hypothetical protein FWH34_07685 [Desulfovibrionaceae bacterium]|nr:hypothetical protein [Desulfovibrionaceae bacterium]
MKKKLEACLETHFGFFLALKELHWLDMNAYDINGKRIHLKRMELYNAIYAAMSKNLSTPASEPLFCGFRHCDVCPRLVRPPEFGVCRCEAHDYKNGITIAYKQALEISSRQTPKHHNSLLEYLQERFLRRLRRALPERYPEGISHAEWWRLLDKDPERLAACNAPVLYDLVPVWQVLPRTRKLVESKGGNPLDSASVIAVLNPSEAGEPPEWKERRAVLNTILACNIAPFRFELAFTEAWLTIRDKLFGHKKHGGARPGSGGARPGAGRPRKHA